MITKLLQAQQCIAEYVAAAEKINYDRDGIHELRKTLILIPELIKREEARLSKCAEK